ncbi:MAG: outer membrane protein [Methylomonas sp.]
MNHKIQSILVILVAASDIAWADQPYNWTGAYAGANLGVIWNNTHLDANHNNFLSATRAYSQNLNTDDVNPGLQFGYLRQLDSHWVVGGEADFTYPSLSKDFVATNGAAFDKFKARYDLQGSLRLRAGYAFDRFLPFITSGVSFGSMSLSYTDEANQNYSQRTVQTGWVLGGGVEYGVLNNLSTRLEYLYTDYAGALNMGVPNVVGIIDPTGSAHADMSTHVLRAAINYRF